MKNEAAAVAESLSEQPLCLPLIVSFGSPAGTKSSSWQ
jgi:hypothetical protein